MSNIITLTTDFGLNDHFVGVMKGVILSINQSVNVIDINHAIESHDIFSAAFSLKSSYKFFPKGTIHLVVIDPGVGSDRKPIVVKTDNYFFIGPDNGVFTFIYEESESYTVCLLENEKFFLKDLSTTFHGRDIFSPVAAHLSLGKSIKDFGNEVFNPRKIEVPESTFTENTLYGEIIYVDKFGNLITNIKHESIDINDQIVVNNKHYLNVSDSYSVAKKGEVVAVCGSTGFLEIAVNCASALEFFGEKNIKIEVIKN